MRENRGQYFLCLWKLIGGSGPLNGGRWVGLFQGRLSSATGEGVGFRAGEMSGKVVASF